MIGSLRRRPVAVVLAAFLSLSSIIVGVPASGASAVTKASTTSSVKLSGASLNFADQFKEYQTIFEATGALRGAPYTVNWSEFVGGPPIIAAMTGGSVDLGDMAETPTIFAQAAGDPVKVVALTKGANPKISPFGILVPKDSPIKTAAQLRGKTIAVQEGTVEQYLLIQILKKAGIPYGAVTVDNLSVTAATTAVTSGKVDAAVSIQPLIGIGLAAGTVKQVTNGAGAILELGYLTASQSALDNPQKRAVIADFVNRFYKAMAILKKNPNLAAQTYVKTYSVTLAVAQQAAASVQAVGTPITPAIIEYQQQEAGTFYKLGLIPQTIKVNSIFDLNFNKQISAAAGLTP
ncbi:MAG TPA: ABC transporter substrate-binding protein [Acidimicrobiales bacterium]|nr:ABC transporter substrate-binding protein [Acidimicrobiales bacterium]